ncbi:hypothetical protein OSB04_013220 [Centaurea solstitialis]|uniref:Uncharacterized protein n=1 Tax=Centaurea solstitialis TaxID=347529 RepID=A0AA38WR55_9ASTR|nr:hypothetical protein OSB04_013220 [Centaurea solstitialis]
MDACQSLVHLVRFEQIKTTPFLLTEHEDHKVEKTSSHITTHLIIILNVVRSEISTTSWDELEYLIGACGGKRFLIEASSHSFGGQIVKYIVYVVSQILEILQPQFNFSVFYLLLLCITKNSFHLGQAFLPFLQLSFDSFRSSQLHQVTRSQLLKQHIHECTKNDFSHCKLEPPLWDKGVVSVTNRIVLYLCTMRKGKVEKVSIIQEEAIIETNMMMEIGKKHITIRSESGLALGLGVLPIGTISNTAEADRQGNPIDLYGRTSGNTPKNEPLQVEQSSNQANGDIKAVLNVFDETPLNNTVIRNCMISGYVKNELICVMPAKCSMKCRVEM